MNMNVKKKKVIYIFVFGGIPILIFLKSYLFLTCFRSPKHITLTPPKCIPFFLLAMLDSDSCTLCSLSAPTIEISSINTKSEIQYEHKTMQRTIFFFLQYPVINFELIPIKKHRLPIRPRWGLRSWPHIEMLTLTLIGHYPWPEKD